MNQQEFRQKLDEAGKIQDKAVKMAQESNILAINDFKSSNALLMESLKLWREGSESAQDSIREAIKSGLLTLTDEQEEKLFEYLSQKQTS